MNSLKETMLDIKGHLYDRITSPFLFTFIVVIIYFYWPVVFTIFDSSLDSKAKIDIIKLYITENNQNISYIVFYTICVLLSYAILNVIGISIKEAQIRCSKKIRAMISKDYIKTEEYRAVISSLNIQKDNLIEDANKKDNLIQRLIRLSHLDDKEKSLMKKLKQNGGQLEIESFKNEDKDILEKISKKQFIDRTDTHFTLRSEISSYIK